MNFKFLIVGSVILASCGAKSPHHHEAQPTSPNVPVTDSDHASEQSPEGTITSSGGYLYGFETNPWFLQNTELVKYCIDVDSANFGVSIDIARSSISFAIETWKEKLAEVKYDRFGSNLKPWNEIRLGTQTFTEVACDSGDVDLRFQLGKLSDRQRAQIGNPRRYVGKAFETSYDEVQMRGAGFIYLAPENGELRPDESEADEQFWNRGDHAALKYVLLHELGHVFGFNHSDNMIMREDGPQYFINKHILGSIESATPGSEIELALKGWLSELFGYSDDAMGVISPSRGIGSTRALFGDLEGIPHAVHCEHNPVADGNNPKCNMYEVTETNTGTYVRGQKIGHIDINTWESGSSPVAYVKLPKSQTVFTLSEQLRRDYGPGQPKLGTTRTQRFAVSGTYVSDDGKVKVPMRVSSMDSSPTSLQIEVTVNNLISVIAN